MSTLLELAGMALAAVATRRGFGLTAAEYVAAGELVVLGLAADGVKWNVRGRAGRLWARRPWRRPVDAS